MHIIQPASQDEPLSFSIAVDGKRLADDISALSTTIELQAGTRQMATLAIAMPDDFEERGDQDMARHFPAGSHITISAGRGDRSDPLFTGKIDNRRLHIGADRLMFIIEASGEASQRDGDPGKLPVTNGEDLIAADLSDPAPTNSVTVLGNAQLLPGDTIALRRVGDPWNGEHQIDAVTHHLESGEWTSRLFFGR